MTDQEQGARAPLKDEYTFYLAEAYVMSVTSPTSCKLWLLDYSNSNKVADWLNNRFPMKKVERELIDVNLEWSLDRVNDDSLVQLAPSFYNEIPLTALYDTLPLGEMQGQIALEQRCWDMIPFDAKPLPLQRDQDYRIQVILQVDGGTVSGGYMGFHARLLEFDPAQQEAWHILFFSWTDDVLGDAWVDLGSSDFDAGRSTLLSSGSGVGSIFVSLDVIGRKSLYFLVGPKVPFGAALQRASLRRLASRELSIDSSERSMVVCGSGADGWLRAARARIPGRAEAGSKIDIETEILRILRTPSGAGSSRLELISHSIQRGEQHILRLGNFDVTMQNLRDLSSELRNAIGHGLRSVYLVGCRTGMGEDARRLLEFWETEFGVKAYGAKRVVGLFDLGEYGVRRRSRHQAFVDAKNVAAPVDSVEHEEMIAAGGVLRPRTREELELLFKEFGTGGLAKLTTGVDLLGNLECFELPGLLADSSGVSKRWSSQAGELLIESLLELQLLRITRTWTPAWQPSRAQAGYESRNFSCGPASTVARSSHRIRSRPLELIFLVPPAVRGALKGALEL